MAAGSRVALACSALALLAPLVGCWEFDAGGQDASARLDAAGSDAAGSDAAGLDAAGLDAAGLDAAGLDAAGLDVGAPVEEEGDAPTRRVEFAPTDAVIANPERGFYQSVELFDESSLGWVRRDHPSDTLIHVYVMLDAFRDRPISMALLTQLRDGLTMVRRDGYQVILRFAYNVDSSPGFDADAPLTRIVAHIAQLAPTLHAFADVIAVVQAGFIGTWGEWRGSTNGLDADPEARRTVAESLLGALPLSRSIQVRYPVFLAELTGGGPLDRAHAWDGSVASRVGLHNDCFVSSATDIGTFPSGEVEPWKTFVASQGLYTPIGGASCEPDPPRSSCENTLAELERQHYSYLNRDYHPEVVAGWADGGCLDEIDRRLGYRLVLVDAALPERVRPGGSFALTVRLRNEGFAAPINPRPVELVLRVGSSVMRVALEGVEVRSWLAGEEQTLGARVRLPASLEEGTASLALRLPSAAEALADRPAYSIRLANEGVWDASTGENRLGAIAIDASAEGTSDPSAASFVILP